MLRSEINFEREWRECPQFETVSLAIGGFATADEMMKRNLEIVLYLINFISQTTATISAANQSLGIAPQLTTFSFAVLSPFV